MSNHEFRPHPFGRQTPGSAVGTGTDVVPTEERRPEFTAEELRVLQPAGDEPDAGADEPPAEAAPSRKSAEARLKELMELRRTDPKAYWSAKIQAEELALIGVGSANAARTAAAEQEAETESEGEEDEAAAGWLPGPEASDLPEELLAKWDAQAGRAFHYRVAQDTVRNIVEGIEDVDERAEMSEAFDALPDAVRHTVFEHLAVSPTPGREASKEEMEKFIAHAEGAELVKEWGKAAARNVRTANSRVKMILDAMPAEHKAAAAEWLGSLSPAKAKSMFAALVR
jgi:hypothetical protein